VTQSSAGEFCVLVSGGWELSLVCVPAAIAATIVITDPPQRREDTPVKLAFEVASVEGLRPVVTGARGHADPAGSAREFRGRCSGRTGRG
ncbi:MAG: hypothetical protein ABJB47_24255, partial [Actinomycetota bacterium]